MKPSIYKITNTVTGRLYVGQTEITLNKRFIQHKGKSKTGHEYLYKSMRKHGCEVFTIELLESLNSPDVMDEREIYWIAKLGTLIPNGYNMTLGGGGGDMSASPRFQEAMKKMHAAKPRSFYAKYGMVGKNHSVQAKQIMSVKRKSHWENMSEEDKKKRGNSVAGENNGMFGKSPPNIKPINVRGQIFKSLNECCKVLHISPKTAKKEGTFL